MKKLMIILIVGSLFIGCSMWDEDSENSASTINPLVGTWNVTNIKYFETLDCSGNPLESIDVNSLEQLAVYGVDEYQIKLTITIDSYIIAINTISPDTSYEREELISTGIVAYKIVNNSDVFCVIWDIGDGDDNWISGGGDGCNACRDYIINGDEAEILAYNCPVPPFPGLNVPCQIYTLIKQ